MVDKRPMGYIPGKGDPLAKKPPPNKKYSHVKAKLDGQTGFTSKDVNIMSDQHVAKRKGELFSRVKALTLIRLIEQDTNQESIYDLNNNEQFEEQKFQQQQQPMQQQYNQNDAESVYSFVTAQTNVTQVSQITQATQQLGITDDINFLLLDMREEDDYQKFHILDAINYPAPNISRDKVIPEIYRYKNKENKMIIFYMQDERQGIPVAQLLSQKGYDNIFLLTGGIESFMQEFPEFIAGNQIPNIPKLNPGDKKKKLVKRSNHKEMPQQQVNFKNKDNTGDKIANTIINNNNQSQALSQANQSDISSVRGGIQNSTLNNKNLQNLRQVKK